MMKERPDRPAALLTMMEIEQNDIAAKFDPRQHDTDAAAQEQSIRLAQRSREKGALSVVSDVGEDGAVQALNLYVKKTKAMCDEIFKPDAASVSAGGGGGGGGGEIQCILTYGSSLRSIVGEGCAPTKKEAKKRAALALVRKIKIETVKEGTI